MDTAISQFRAKELTGNNDGTKVEAYLATTGLGKEYPWSSAFVNWNKQNGIKGANRARALSWNTLGLLLELILKGKIVFARKPNNLK